VFVSRCVLAEVTGEHGHVLAVDVTQVIEEELGLVRARAAVMAAVVATDGRVGEGAAAGRAGRLARPQVLLVGPSSWCHEAALDTRVHRLRATWRQS
jgi:hypothetical protein